MASAATEPAVRVDVLGDGRAALHEATAQGLRATPKQLPTLWLYDERGSRLYDEITQLPDYYLPRCEGEILRARAASVAERTGARTLVELGAGSARNTRYLLDALELAGTLERFVPFDASEQALRASARAIAASHPGIAVHAVVGDFERDLAALPRHDRRLVAFLGSTIGNLEPVRRARFLENVAATLGDGDALLLGIDLVKDASRLEAAYVDRGGVTEAFVRNALDAVNGELGATFDQSRFAYEARWDRAREWMDIGFRALTEHTVSVAGLELDVPFAAGEQLEVEISAKFRREGLEAEAAHAGLRVDAWWTDPAADFAVVLLFAND